MTAGSQVFLPPACQHPLKRKEKKKMQKGGVFSSFFPSTFLLKLCKLVSSFHDTIPNPHIHYKQIVE